MHMIPFTVFIKAKDRDSRLDEKLKAEGGGILNWMIEGCLQWQKTGLNPPERVLATTEQYFDDQDTLGAFFEERCHIKEGLWTPTSVLYAAYTGWSRSAGEYALSRKRFLDQLAFKELYSEKRCGDMAVEGISLKPTESQKDWMDDYD